MHFAGARISLEPQHKQKDHECVKETILFSTGCFVILASSLSCLLLEFVIFPWHTVAHRRSGPGECNQLRKITSRKTRFHLFKRVFNFISRIDLLYKSAIWLKACLAAWQFLRTQSRYPPGFGKQPARTGARHQTRAKTVTGVDQQKVPEESKVTVSEHHHPQMRSTQS